MSKIIHQLKHPSTFASHHTDPRASFLPSTFRPLTFGLLLTFHFSLLIFNSCGLDVEDSTPPSAPVWVQKSLPEEWPERGIDAHESGGIYLEWYPNPAEDDVQTYLLYRAEYFDSQESLGDYELLCSLESGTEGVIEFVDQSSSQGIRYHYVLISEDASGKPGLPSDTLSYLRFRAVESASMIPNGLDITLSSGRKLQWSYPYTTAMENYVVTILDVEDNLVLRQELVPGNYIGGWEYFTIPDSITFQSETVYKWRVDMGAQYVDDLETTGSESLWAMFLYVGD